MALLEQDFHLHKARAAKFRKLLIQRIKARPEKKVAVLLSSGVDSHCVLFAALAAGKQVSCYTFGMKQGNSKDVRVAARTADALKLPWTFVGLDGSIDVLKKHILYIHQKLCSDWHINKSSIECLWPILTTFPHVKERLILTGLGGDVPFATVRSWKKVAEAGGVPAYEKLKNNYVNTRLQTVGDVQSICHARWLAKHKPGTKILSPLDAAAVIGVFKGMHPLTEGNKPMQKAPMRLAFWDEFVKCPPLIHQSFSVGDTGISDAFEVLLKTEWNINGYKSVKGIYNSVARGDITSMHV